MRKHRLFFADIDGFNSYFLITDGDLFFSNGLGVQLLSHIGSVFDCSLHPSKYIPVPASVVLCEAFSCISKLAGAFVFWFSGASYVKRKLPDSHVSRPRNSKYFRQVKHVTSTKHNFTGSRPCLGSRHESFASLFSTLSIKLQFRRAVKFQSIPVLSLAAALIPPLDNFTSNMLAIPPEESDVHMLGSLDQRCCNVKRQGFVGHFSPDINCARHTVEPRTGIEFPIILDNISSEKSTSSVSSEVLVGMGSRTMTIIKIKSLEVYAFGFYVHPFSVRQKLGPKYASFPEAELKKHHDFFEDLLREDIGMTVRLVVNCNGMKINTVKDAFEKSLRARLLKTNPETDFKCISTFSSCFTRDIPLPAGTIIDFRRTADGQLVTEIGGNQIGAVQSRELCRAFFDMYIGKIPVSERTKEEIGRNVAGILRGF